MSDLEDEAKNCECIRGDSNRNTVDLHCGAAAKLCGRVDRWGMGGGSSVIAVH